MQQQPLLCNVVAPHDPSLRALLLIRTILTEAYGKHSDKRIIPDTQIRQPDARIK